jgi:hypothetical protein
MSKYVCNTFFHRWVGVALSCCSLVTPLLDDNRRRSLWDWLCLLFLCINSYISLASSLTQLSDVYIHIQHTLPQRTTLYSEHLSTLNMGRSFGPFIRDNLHIMNKCEIKWAYWWERRKKRERSMHSVPFWDNAAAVYSSRERSSSVKNSKTITINKPWHIHRASFDGIETHIDSTWKSSINSWTWRKLFVACIRRRCVKSRSEAYLTSLMAKPSNEILWKNE